MRGFEASNNAKTTLLGLWLGLGTGLGLGLGSGVVLWSVGNLAEELGLWRNRTRHSLPVGTPLWGASRHSPRPHLVHHVH